MKDVNTKKNNGDIEIYIEDQEYIANNYVMKFFTVYMVIYTGMCFLNQINVFVIEKNLMLEAYFSSLIIYVIAWFAAKKISLSDRKMKYFLLFCIMAVSTITGVFLTYHVVVATMLPILYALLYSSKPVMWYVYVMTIISTIIIVYGGYYWGLCDANMVLLTTGSLSSYISGDVFTQNAINPNPEISLLLYFVMPRCLIYLAFMVVCKSLLNIVSVSLEKARLTAELEKAKETAESAKEAAENANKAKSQFLAKMSHEIRTPVNAVMGMSEMILRESKEESIRKYALDAKNSSTELLNLINEILDSSKIESGKMEIVCAEYDIRSMLNDLYNMIKVKAGENGLQLVFDIDVSAPSRYYGDDMRIKQVLRNLLTNAVKYTEKGQVTLKLSYRVEGENAVLCYKVQDTGIGIRQEDMEKIYDTFSRLDLSRNRNVEGTGLGMSIVQQLLKLMGSRLQIQSEYGKGSEFSFELVQKIVDDKPVGNFRERFLQASDEKAGRSEYTAPEAKILVVDDNAINLKVFKGLLKNTKMTIQEATSGRQCLELLENHSYDIVFMDHMMPEMDGIETLHIIRERKLCEGVPVIMLTANAIVGDRERYIREGFDDFLSKPIIPEKLDEMILQYLPPEFVLRESEVLKEQKSADDVLGQIQEQLPEINTQTGLATCSGNVDFYLELFRDFTQVSIQKELTEFFAARDHKNYCIRIHGFKNNAYSIGAKELGDLAFDMEKKTREGMPEELEELQKKFLEQYDRICRIFKEIEH